MHQDWFCICLWCLFLQLCIHIFRHFGPHCKYSISIVHVAYLFAVYNSDAFLWQAAGRQSRQAEEEVLEGVWGAWSEWVECSQSCGVGVSERRRQCMPPPQTPPHIYNRPSYPQPGVGPYSLYPVNEPPPYGAGGAERPPYFSPPLPANPNPGLPLYRNEAGGAGPVQFGPPNQDPVSVYRSPSSSSALPYGRVPARSPNHGRALGSGSRRSVSPNRGTASIRRWAGLVREDLPVYISRTHW